MWAPLVVWEERSARGWGGGNHVGRTGDRLYMPVMRVSIESDQDDRKLGKFELKLIRRNPILKLLFFVNSMDT